MYIVRENMYRYVRTFDKILESNLTSLCVYMYVHLLLILLSMYVYVCFHYSGMSRKAKEDNVILLSLLIFTALN